MDYKIDAKVKQSIKEAIEKLEAKSDVELVSVITKSSDEYSYIPILWASIIALSLPSFGFMFLGIDDYIYLYKVQILMFVVFAILFSFDAIKPYIIPKSIKHKRASRFAKSQFITLGLHKTESANGAMLFVSIDERYIEIVTDHKISTKIDNKIWQNIIGKFLHDIKQDRFSQGFLNAIKEMSKVLEKEFPKTKTSKNELPNYLIEL